MKLLGYNEFMKKITKITLKEIENLAEAQFGDLVKGVVDIENKVMVLGGELHADEEALLLGGGSRQVDLWGINLYPEFYGKEEFVEFDSMINIRPSSGNMSRGVEDENVRKMIIEIVNEIVRK